MTAVLQLSDLRAGDVLLHMGTGELSKLIAWVGDSAYSHAAMVIEDGLLIEAATKGVRHASLADRVKMTANFHYIDAFRPLRPGAKDTTDLAALIAAADVYLGRPYPMTSLFTLGIICAVRNKIPGDERLHAVLRFALDLVVTNDPSMVVCSELVYRGFDEALTTPPHALRLPVTHRASQGTPPPDIDLKALFAETIEDLERSRQNPGLRQAQSSAPSLATMNATNATNELPDLLARARRRLGANLMQTSSVGYSPNPKTILPADLEFSSGLQKVGRLALIAPA